MHLPVLLNILFFLKKNSTESYVLVSLSRPDYILNIPYCFFQKNTRKHFGFTPLQCYYLLKVFDYPFETQRPFLDTLCHTELFCIMWLLLLYSEIQTYNINLGNKYDMTLVEWRCNGSCGTVNRKDLIIYPQLIADLISEPIVKEKPWRLSKI